MISIVKLILEGKEQKFDYGCAMLYFQFPDMNKIQDAIDPKDLYKGEEGDKRTYGFEDQPHCTLLFGLHPEVTLEQVKGVLDKFSFGELTAKNISTFTNPKYDVLKFDIRYPKSNDRGIAYLDRVNKELSKFPNTNDFPDYHPHATIAYLKSGTGAKYIKAFKGIEFDVTPEYVVYSVPDGTQHKIEINKK
jgi:2'-5' RNA ligase